MENEKFVLCNIQIPVYHVTESITELEKASIIIHVCSYNSNALFWLINNLGHAMQAGHENFNSSELGEALMVVSEIGQAMWNETTSQIEKLEMLAKRSNK